MIGSESEDDRSMSLYSSVVQTALSALISIVRRVPGSVDRSYSIVMTDDAIDDS